MALLRDLWMPSDVWNVTGPVWPAIEAANFELRPGLIALVQQNQFKGLPTEDPHEHIRNVLEYANTVQYHQVSRDVIRCMLFTFSLRDAAKEWYHSLPSREFSWEQISQAFLEKYFPLHKQAATRDQIFSFTQHDGESLFDAWERYKALLRRCPNRGLERWLEVQIFYRGLTCASRRLIDMSAEGSIMTKTIEDAILLIDSLTFHQFQWDSKHPVVTNLEQLAAVTKGELETHGTMKIAESAPQSQISASGSEHLQVVFCGQQHLKSTSNSLYDKLELELILFDDDDAILSDTLVAAPVGTIATDPIHNLDNSFMCEPELQSVAFDIKKLPSLAIDDVLLEIDMEKFTFEDVNNIDSYSFEPEMEIFIVDYDEATSDVEKRISPTSIVDVSPREISTIASSVTSTIKVVPKLFLNHLRYDFNLLNKAHKTIDNAYAISIDDLEGTVPITCVGCFVLSFFRFMFVHHPWQVDLRDDIPWDPGGFIAW